MRKFFYVRLNKFWKILGPGFTTGAADDDPSGIATYSQAGAQFGLSMLWLAPLSFPLMSLVQEMCARIGIATGRGLAANIRRHFPRPILYFVTFLLIGANILNIGADLGAMAQALQLLIPVPTLYIVVFFAVVSLLLQIFLSYATYARYLKWLALILLAYVVSALSVSGIDWSKVLLKAVTPEFLFNREFILMVCAILGTTISPYLFFWQTSQEVEDGIEKGRTSIAKRADAATPKAMRSMQIDVWFGMLFSNLIMFFIIAATAFTLFQSGAGEITSAADAALALRPFVGDLSYMIFALGIIGTGLLAIPVLAGSAAYALSESLGLREGLNKKWHQAVPFYTILIFSVVVGALINVLGIDSIKTLIYSAILNGLVAPFILIVIVLLSQNKQVMGKYVNNPITTIFGWIVAGIMSVVGVIAVYSLIQ